MYDGEIELVVTVTTLDWACGDLPSFLVVCLCAGHRQRLVHLSSHVSGTREVSL